MKYAFEKARIIWNFLSGRRDFVLTGMKKRVKITMVNGGLFSALFHASNIHVWPDKLSRFLSEPIVIVDIYALRDNKIATRRSNK